MRACSASGPSTAVGTCSRRPQRRSSQAARRAAACQEKLCQATVLLHKRAFPDLKSAATSGSRLRNHLRHVGDGKLGDAEQRRLVGGVAGVNVASRAINGI